MHEDVVEHAVRRLARVDIVILDHHDRCRLAQLLGQRLHRLEHIANHRLQWLGIDGRQGVIGIAHDIDHTGRQLGIRQRGDAVHQPVDLLAVDLRPRDALLAITTQLVLEDTAVDLDRLLGESQLAQQLLRLPLHVLVLAQLVVGVLDAMHRIGDVLEAIGTGIALDRMDVAEQLGQFAEVLLFGLLDDGPALVDEGGRALDEVTELVGIHREDLADDHQFLLLPFGLGLQRLQRSDVTHGDHQLGDHILIINDRIPVQLDQLVRLVRKFEGQLGHQQVRIELVHHRVFADDGRHRSGSGIDNVGTQGRALEHEVDDVAVGDFLGLEDGLQVRRILGMDQATVDDGEQPLVHVGEHVGDVFVLLLQRRRTLFDLALQGTVVFLDHLDHADVLDGGNQGTGHRRHELVVAVGEGHLVHFAGEVHHADQDVLVDQRYAEQCLGFLALAADIGLVTAGVRDEQRLFGSGCAADNALAHGEGDRRRRAVHLLGRQESLGLQLVVLVEQVHRAALDADLLVHGMQHQLQRGVLIACRCQGTADAVELGQVDHLLANGQTHGVEVLRRQGQQDDQDHDGAFETETDAVAQLGLQAIELGICRHQHFIQAGNRLRHR